jgi:predicted RNA-binding protein with TRAM domain
MASRCASIGAALVVASLSAGSTARAAPSAADRETARSLMQEGRTLRDKGDMAGALRRFQAADSIMHVPTTGLEVAKTQVALGLVVEALDSIAAIRQTPAKPGDPSQFKEARENADKLEGSLEGRVPALTIVVKGAAAGDTPAVTVDDVALPAEVVGLPRKVDPGHHVVVAKTAHGEGKQEVDITAGQQKEVQIALVATEPAAGAEPTASPAPVDETPPAPTTSHAPTALTWVGVALAGAGVAVGTVAGIVSLSKKSLLENECANKICGPSSYATLDSANSFATMSTIAFAAAGVGAGVAVVTLLVGHSTSSAPPASQPPEALRVSPWIGAGAAGVRGSF